MLYEFLLKNEKEILAASKKKTVELAGVRPNSDQLKKGLPIFYKQLLAALKLVVDNLNVDAVEDKPAKASAARQNDEAGIVAASTHPEEAAVATQAGIHGAELLRLGYTLSHVVHTYGSMCQSITEVAEKTNFVITSQEFNDLNRCLDVAMAGAVTTFQDLRNAEVRNQEVEHLGHLAHELRNALGTVTMSLELIKDGTLGFKGNTGRVLDRGLQRMEDLIARSLTEVRLRIEPKVLSEPIQLFQLVNQIVLTAAVQAQAKNQTLDIQIDPKLVFQADSQLVYSALSNLIQNAIKYTRTGGQIQVRSFIEAETIFIEVEDECGGLPDSKVDLFKAFEQQNEDRTGLGLGLTIAQRAIKLNNGSIKVRNLPGKGCVFKIALPNKSIEASRKPELQKHSKLREPDRATH